MLFNRQLLKKNKKYSKKEQKLNKFGIIFRRNFRESIVYPKIQTRQKIKNNNNNNNKLIINKITKIMNKKKISRKKKNSKLNKNKNKKVN